MAKVSISLVYVLNSNTTYILPAKKVIMEKDKNKAALRTIHTCVMLMNPTHVCKLQLIGNNSGYRHEEANLKLIINLLEMLPQWKHIRVLADDTDIFVLRVFSILQNKFQAQVSKRIYNGKVVDIKATISKLGDKSGDRLALQAPGIILWYSVIQIVRHQFDGQDGSPFEDIHGESSIRRRVDGMNLYTVAKL